MHKLINSVTLLMSLHRNGPLEKKVYFDIYKNVTMTLSIYWNSFADQLHLWHRDSTHLKKKKRKNSLQQDRFGPRKTFFGNELRTLQRVRFVHSSSKVTRHKSDGTWGRKAQDKSTPAHNPQGPRDLLLTAPTPSKKFLEVIYPWL